ncbi:MAG: DUF6746 family protein [Halopseudomonas sp.]|uniref:DUF6746 family protein n=1 Tax=Halopseudomonas sp. TaxID=2901191 RepID=UPI0030015010
MKVHLLPVSLTVAMMSPAMVIANPASTASGHSLHAAVMQLSAHNQFLQQLLNAPLDSATFSLMDELSYQLESDLLLLGTPSAPVAAPLESLHQAVEHQDGNAVLLHATAYLSAAQLWLGLQQS